MLLEGQRGIMIDCVFKTRALHSNFACAALYGGKMEHSVLLIGDRALLHLIR